MTVRRFADASAVADAAADELVAIAAAAIAARGTCAIALSGGSTPRKLHAALARRGRAVVDWDHVELWFGDERAVPPEHPDSNYRMAMETLVTPLALDPTRVHRMVAEGAERDAAARAYEASLPARFDLVFLGMGADGHTASLFPGSAGLAEASRLVVANLVAPETWRMTLTYPALAAARHVRFLVTGADKAGTLAEVLEGPPDRYPSQRVAGVDVAWFVDAAAAAQLKPGAAT
ncbi:MAG: 6-phosphogluconolactonase [Proteobacteria bacterium]|nr:6-phosphogluconolactonase [Pseudomonadota bacterium]